MGSPSWTQCIYLKKREDKTESVGLRGVGGGVNMIKTHCIEILKN